METQQSILRVLSIVVELITFCNVCTSSAIPGLITFYSKSDFFTVTLSRRKQSNVHRSSNKGPRYICTIFNKSVHSLDRFSYVSNIKFRENPCSGSRAEYMRTDEWKHVRTDTTKLIDSFREYSHPPKRVGVGCAEGKAVYTCPRLHDVL
jgi:hypothetical protein